MELTYVIDAIGIIEQVEPVSSHRERSHAAPPIDLKQDSKDPLVEVELPKPSLDQVIRAAAAWNRGPLLWVDLDVGSIEYRGLSGGDRSMVWIRGMLEELGPPIQGR
jgi:hypothetical protein